MKPIVIFASFMLIALLIVLFPVSCAQEPNEPATVETIEATTDEANNVEKDLVVFVKIFAISFAMFVGGIFMYDEDRNVEFISQMMMFYGLFMTLLTGVIIVLILL